MLSFVYLILRSSILPDIPTQWKEMRNLLLIYLLILMGYAQDLPNFHRNYSVCEGIGFSSSAA